MKKLHYVTICCIALLVGMKLSAQESVSTIHVNKSLKKEQLVEKHERDTIRWTKLNVQGRNTTTVVSDDYPKSYSVNKKAIQNVRTKEFVAYEIRAVESKLASVKGNEDLYRKYKKNGWVKATEKRLKALKEEFTNFDR